MPKANAVTKAQRPPDYVEWRGELLAELALLRVPGVVVVRRPSDSESKSNKAGDFCAVSMSGLAFWVVIKAFSSWHHDIDRASSGEWRVRVPMALIERARALPAATLLFVLDADTDAGRYLRLDTIEPGNGSGSKVATLIIPPDHELTKERLARAIGELEKQATAARRHGA